MERLSRLIKPPVGFSSGESNQRSGSGSSEPLYRHKRLPGDKWIRLLVLKPGSGKLECSLVRRPVRTSFLKYEALSYAWGPQENLQRLDCDGRALWIGPSLAAALHALRHDDKQRVLWIDAVCINQEDLEERSRQVAMMGKIYSRAREVLVWVGEDRSGVAKGCFNLIKATNEVISRMVLKYGDIYSVPDLSDAPICRDEDQWLMVQQLTQQAWFGRVWVLQEVGLARSATIQWGRTRFPFGELVELMVCLAMRGDLSAFLGNATPRYGPIYDAYYSIWRSFDNAVSWRNDMPVLRTVNQAWAESSLHFIDVIFSGTGYKAKDARDYVYAFLGHPTARMLPRDNSPAQLIVDADYHISVDDLYLRVAKKILQNERFGWMVFSYIDHVDDSPSLDGRRPSWVPRWDDDFGLTVLGDQRSWFRAGGPETVDFRSQITVDQGFGSLRSRSIMLGTVVWVSQEMKGYGDNAWVRRLQESVKQAWEELQSLHDKNGPYGGTSDEREYAFSLTIQAGVEPVHKMPAEDDPQSHKHLYAAYKAERDGILQGSSSISSNPGENTHQGPRSASKFATVEFVRTQRMFLHQRRIILTSDGFYGLGHRVTKVGDQVGVIRGSYVPFLLRPVDAADLPDHQRTFVSQMGTQQAPNVYRLVSDCYVQGIMRGQVIDEIDGANESGLLETDIVIV